MLTRFDKVEILKHAHNLLLVTFSNFSSNLPINLCSSLALNCEVASELYRSYKKYAN